MTYRSRGRSVFEVIVAICFVTFLVGFILVLCVGNFYRAKRAAERQRQRRVVKLAEPGPNTGKPDRSPFFGNSSSSVNRGDGPSSEAGSYEPPRMGGTGSMA